MSVITLQDYTTLMELPPESQLRVDDGVPVDTFWHRYQISLLIESVDCHLLPSTDHFTGGNNFIYYTREQWDPELQDRPEFRGPDFFFVDNVTWTRVRKMWVVWLEHDRYPDVVIELGSPSTKKLDLSIKKDIYEQVFKSAEYYFYDPDKEKLIGWRLKGGDYRPIKPSDKGFMWCKTLGLWLGTWNGTYVARTDVWLRFFDENLRVIETFAEQEHRLAKKQKQRADALEAEVARLKKLLADKGSGNGPKKNGKNGKK